MVIKTKKKSTTMTRITRQTSKKKGKMEENAFKGLLGTSHAKHEHGQAEQAFLDQ